MSWNAAWRRCLRDGKAVKRRERAEEQVEKSREEVGRHAARPPEQGAGGQACESPWWLWVTQVSMIFGGKVEAGTSWNNKVPEAW